MTDQNKSTIPESLRQQLARAGRKGSKSLTPEQRREYGKKGWAARVAKAEAAEKARQEKAPAS